MAEGESDADGAATARPRPSSCRTPGDSGPGSPGWPARRPSFPELEPLLRTLRKYHPKADTRLVERAYEMAAYLHRDQKRRSGEAYITHPLAVATILADLGMTAPDARGGAAARHGRGLRLRARRAARGLRRRDRPARRRRHQARQGQVRRGVGRRDRPQDGHRDGPRHPGARHQARRPAAQHAHPAVDAARRSSRRRPARPSRSTPRSRTGSA